VEPQEAVDIACNEIREAFFRVTGQVHDYDTGIRAWVYALTDALETSLEAIATIKRGDFKVDPEKLAASKARIAEARARYSN